MEQALLEHAHPGPFLRDAGSAPATLTLPPFALGLSKGEQGEALLSLPVGVAAKGNSHDEGN